MRETFAGFRASEIKHGRMAVIAAWDRIVPELARFPEYRSTPKAVTFGTSSSAAPCVCPPSRRGPVLQHHGHVEPLGPGTSSTWGFHHERRAPGQQGSLPHDQVPP